MFEMIRRIFKIAGRSRKKIIVGITFNILKSFFNGFMMFGVFWILLHLENLTPTIILQAFGVVLGSVIGRFFFQWMYDRNADFGGLRMCRLMTSLCFCFERASRKPQPQAPLTAFPQREHAEYQLQVCSCSCS